MEKKEFLKSMEEIINNSKVGILATVDNEGNPHMRWMTPGFLSGRDGTLYAVTSKSFTKINQLEKNPNIEWQFQTKTLDKIATVKGFINLIDNSALKMEVIESIGSRLSIFWKLNEDPSSLIVLETVITSGQIFIPLKGEKFFTSFE